MMLRRQQGIALLEALLATLILAIGLLGTIGLQARAYSSLSDASMRAEATIASEKLMGLISTDLSNLNDYALVANATPGARLATWSNETRAAIPGAVLSVAIAAASASADSTTSAVTVRISWQRKAGGPTNVHTVTSYVSRST